MIGGAGDDTFNGGAGNDTLYGWGGDDTFNVSGKSGNYAETINGGSGTDSLIISYSGVSSLANFTVGYSHSDAQYQADSVITLTDSNGGVITLSGIESLTVNGITYSLQEGTLYDGVGFSKGFGNIFWEGTDNTIHAFGTASFKPSDAISNNYLTGISASDGFNYYGSPGIDSLNLNADRNTYTGKWIINLSAGNDSINSAKLKNGDSIDMGAGDDTLNMMTGGSNGTPAIGSASFAKLDGGAGTDTISWDESITADGATLTLSTDGAVNFENLTGSNYADTLTGDANANVLTGLGGADTLNGLAGNDELIADDSSRTTNDLLYGGAGDDTLYGSNGNNTLDGGTGKDTISSGGGNDTIVIRSGDGGTDIANADVLTDFADGTDVIGMDGLSFDNLTISQGTGDYSSHVVVKYGTEFLIIIQNTNVSNITDLDFTPI